jgi:hypothetical protein
MTSRVALTTVDNPYNPFTQFDDWFQFDCQHDYGTCEFLARFCYTSDQLSPAENFQEAERAIDDIIKHDVRKIYKKVYESEKQNEEELVTS